MQKTWLVGVFRGNADGCSMQMEGAQNVGWPWLAGLLCISEWLSSMTRGPTCTVDERPLCCPTFLGWVSSLSFRGELHLQVVLSLHAPVRQMRSRGNAVVSQFLPRLSVCALERAASARAMGTSSLLHFSALLRFVWLCQSFSAAFNCLMGRCSAAERATVGQDKPAHFHQERKAICYASRIYKYPLVPKHKMAEEDKLRSPFK